MAILRLCRDDVNESMIEAASFGRDCDTTAIAGALHGASAIRADWIETAAEANEVFFQKVEGDPKANSRSMARQLVGALRAERRATQARVAVREETLW